MHIKEFAKRETSRKRPARLTFYDAKGGAAGSGIAAKAFDFIDLLLRQACDRIEACHCHEGCIECVCSERCKEQNIVMSKAGSEVILKSLLGRHIDVDALPWGPEEAVPAGIETVILAEEVRSRGGRRLIEMMDQDVIKLEEDDDDEVELVHERVVIEDDAVEQDDPRAPGASPAADENDGPARSSDHHDNECSASAGSAEIGPNDQIAFTTSSAAAAAQQDLTLEQALKEAAFIKEEPVE